MRIRTVKPEFFTHPEILALSLPARLLLISLWGQADDEGKLYDQPQKIRGNAFGPDDRVNIETLLGELEEHGRILRYESNERRCIFVLKFTTHQTIPPSKRKPTSIPLPTKPLLEVYDPAAVLLLFGSNGAAKSLHGGDDLGLALGSKALRPTNKTLHGAAEKLHRDLFAAIAEVCGYDLKSMTDSERGRTGRAAKELAVLGEKPEEVGRFAKDWAQTYPDAVLSPQAITNNWSSYCTGRMEKAGKARRR